MSELQPWCKRYGAYHRADADGQTIGTVERAGERWFGVACGGEINNGGNGYGSPEAARSQVDRTLKRIGFKFAPKPPKRAPSSIRLEDLRPRIKEAAIGDEPRAATIRRLVVLGLEHRQLAAHAYDRGIVAACAGMRRADLPIAEDILRDAGITSIEALRATGASALDQRAVEDVVRGLARMEPERRAAVLRHVGVQP